MIKLLGKYINGNYSVSIYSDGTKVRETLVPEDNVFIAEFPECIDLKITNQCDAGCIYCHEDSILDGLQGDILNAEFINTLRPYTEVAIGGGNPLSHPDLFEFLDILKSKNIIANITVNQRHFISQQDIIKRLAYGDLIKGLGISLVSVNDEFISLMKQYDNAVLHVINGIVKLDDLQKLYDQGLKVLILGYKEIRRGRDFYSPEVEVNKKEIYDNISEIAKGFDVISFDNLAIKQLELRRLFSDKQWEEFYMGDDGQHTMYIDLVLREFAMSSTSKERYNLKNDIVDMFEVIKALL